MYFHQHYPTRHRPCSRRTMRGRCFIDCTSLSSRDRSKGNSWAYCFASTMGNYLGMFVFLLLHLLITNSHLGNTHPILHTIRRITGRGRTQRSESAGVSVQNTMGCASFPSNTVVDWPVLAAKVTSLARIEGPMGGGYSGPC